MKVSNSKVKFKPLSNKAKCDRLIRRCLTPYPGRGVCRTRRKRRFAHTRKL